MAFPRQAATYLLSFFREEFNQFVWISVFQKQLLNWREAADMFSAVYPARRAMKA
jgi:hypothetical protein